MCQQPRPLDTRELIILIAPQIFSFSLHFGHLKLFNLHGIFMAHCITVIVQLERRGMKLHFYLQPSSGVPIYKQIIKQIKHAAAGGLLSAGDQLPSVRELSEDLTINPNTVSKAYQELERDGIIEIIHGVGTFVSKGNIFMEEKEKEGLMKNAVKQLFTEAYHLGFSFERLKGLFLEAYEDAAVKGRKGD